ncbi:hypothetical protein LTR28_014088, partial [Elasticomyces elasticus]
ETDSFDFDSPAQFTFLEFVEQAGHVSGDVSGKVYVRPAPPTQQTSIQVNVSLAITDVDINVAENMFDPDIQSRSSPSSDDMTAGGINITNATDITTISGDVSSTYWSSRETRIDVTSGSVSGTYALRDLLSIKTKSGSISVDVVPKSADRTSPRPADFSAISAGGSITARFPITGTGSDIPEREYRTRVQADSGSLH